MNAFDQISLENFRAAGWSDDKLKTIEETWAKEAESRKDRGFFDLDFSGSSDPFYKALVAVGAGAAAAGLTTAAAAGAAAAGGVAAASGLGAIFEGSRKAAETVDEYYKAGRKLGMERENGYSNNTINNRSFEGVPIGDYSVSSRVRSSVDSGQDQGREEMNLSLNAIVGQASNAANEYLNGGQKRDLAPSVEAGYSVVGDAAGNVAGSILLPLIAAYFLYKVVMK